MEKAMREAGMHGRPVDASARYSLSPLRLSLSCPPLALPSAFAVVLDADPRLHPVCSPLMSPP